MTLRVSLSHKDESATSFVAEAMSEHKDRRRVRPELVFQVDLSVLQRKAGKTLLFIASVADSVAVRPCRCDNCRVSRGIDGVMACASVLEVPRSPHFACTMLSYKLRRKSRSETTSIGLGSRQRPVSGQKK